MYTSSFQELSTENILKYIEQKQIIAYYAKLDDRDMQGAFCSPFREDSKPSCSLYWSGNRLKIKDWAKQKSYDCFDTVKLIKQCNFYEALKHINEDFNLKLGTFEVTNRPIIKEDKKLKVTHLLTIEEVEFDDFDVSYWGSMYISASTLNKYKVTKVKQTYKNTLPFTNSYKGNPIYAYKDFKEGFKLYRPFSPNDTHKWYAYKTNDE